MNIKERKKVYVAWVNTDLTEGKGHQVPLAVCELEATAIRLGTHQDVQGTDATVMEDWAFTMPDSPYRWYIPGRVIQASVEDKKVQELRDAKRIVIAKLREAGITEEELKLISNL